METTLRYYLANPSRRRTVTILTLGLGLLVIWPGVDEYTARSATREDLAGQLVEMRETVTQLRQSEADAKENQAQLARLEALTVKEDSLHKVRGRIVELARESSCQIRQVREGQPRKQAWRPGENPLEQSNRADSASAGYVLTIHELSLTVSGEQANVEQFLDKLSGMEVMIHTQQLNLRSSDGTEKEVILELGLWLFDLTLREAPAA